MEGFNEGDDIVEPITYICGECGNDVALQSTAAVRCRNCGSRILYKKRSYRELKALAELLYSASEDKIVEEYEKFEFFKLKLDSLLSTITRYRIQLSDSQEKTIFGPKTLKIVNSLVSDYDKLYEAYEDHLYNIYTPIQHLYNEYKKNKEVEQEPEKVEFKSIVEETKLNLKQIEEVKEKLKEAPKEVNFSNIKNEDLPSNTLFDKILDIYKSEPCNDLETIVIDICNEHPDDFLKIVQNLSNLFNEISRKPDEVNLRLLRINNEKLQEDFLKYFSSAKILRYAGFRIAQTHEISDHLQKLNIKHDDEYFLYLNEPDMFTSYNKWKDWLNRINFVSEHLKSFLSNYKRLRRSDADLKTIVSSSLR
ncbi:putative RPC10 subunit of RNA polymerases I, II, and III [Theileria orientalis]|uniref:RPC10 subunit of RNA polymerases I, II, and III n=1 Tax=Theileria orientalis TaxID=68886 RepID=A0A976M7T3_THEOR|nr:putative RPC10 subunit of RNA polymerases I, II, and III [Theileria orientalis]